MPKVSIILTSYNHEKYIRKSIESVLSQTYTDFELIIVDDASSDGSWNVINSFTDSRVKTFLNTYNIGTVSVLNKYISEVASGEYIAIHHSDDYWHETKLEKQVKYLEEHDDVGAAFTLVRVVNADGSDFADKNHFYDSVFDQANRSRYQWLNHFFFHGNCLCHPSVLIRKECYQSAGLYDYRLCQLPDFDMWVRLVLRYNIYILEEQLTFFRVTGEESSESGNRKETRIRSRLELDQVVRNFNKIESFDEMVEIFPEAGEYYLEESVPLDFVLAMVSLGEKTSGWHNKLGIDILFNILSIPARVQELQSMYDFGYKDFIEITGKIDSYCVDQIHDCNVALRDCVKLRDELLAECVKIQAQRVKIQAECVKIQAECVKIHADHDEAIIQRNAVSSELELVYSSNSWKLTSPLRKISGLFK